MVNWTILDPNSNCWWHWVPIRVSGSHLNQHSTWPHLPIHWTRFSSATTWASIILHHHHRRESICLATIPHPHHHLQSLFSLTLSLSQQLCNKRVCVCESMWWIQNLSVLKVRSLREQRFSTTCDGKLNDPIHQKAVRRCFRILWPQHSTGPIQHNHA